MRAVVQRVKSASVNVDAQRVSGISQGLLILLGIHKADTEAEAKWMINKLVNLRIFPDDEGRMNRSVLDVAGEILVVSQFTLYGDAGKGFRPSFIEAARPETAEPLYNQMIKALRHENDLRIETGIFGAMMDVELVNWGPVTILLETKEHRSAEEVGTGG